MEDNVAYGEKYHLRAGEWYPHRPGNFPDEEAAGEEDRMMWDLILRDFLASLPLED
ncbi:MAG: hypothetical protein AB1503_10020 [Bacillota bacterium]|nr:hypothetical protein [Bacillota bacterium]